MAVNDEFVRLLEEEFIEAVCCRK